MIAGNGNLGPSGDGGPAVDAALSDPMGLAVDAVGNVYVADTLDSRIRKVTPDGTITTVAGDSIQAYFGDGGLATEAALYFPHDVTVDPSGNLYVADTSNNVVRMLHAEAPAIFANGVVNSATLRLRLGPARWPPYSAPVLGIRMPAQVFRGTFARRGLGHRQWESRASLYVTPGR